MADILMNKEQIMEIIPHRDPFLLIDEIVDMEVGVKVHARKYIKGEDFWFKGHFPGYPVTHNRDARSGRSCLYAFKA